MLSHLVQAEKIAGDGRAHRLGRATKNLLRPTAP